MGLEAGQFAAGMWLPITNSVALFSNVTACARRRSCNRPGHDSADPPGLDPDPSECVAAPVRGL